MKKLIVIAFTCMFMTHTMAQDIVRYGDSCYLFNTISINDLIASPWPGNPAYFMAPLFNYGTRYNVPDNTVIYGIAATMDIDEKINDSAGYTMYLYTVDNNNLIYLLDSITKYSYEKQYVYAAMNNTVLVESAVPCYEYYFSQPHLLQGPVYIGARKDSQYTGAFYSGYDMSRNQKWIWFDDTNALSIVHIWDEFWGGLFPIIQENIGCDAAVPEIIELGEKDVLLAWEMEGDSCQLSITLRDMPVDSGMVIDLQSTDYTVMGLDSGYYAARLRTQCHHHCLIHADSLVWSDWGEPLVFYFGTPDTTGGIGIRLVETAPDCSLTPNPAHVSVTVQCGEGIKRVELFTVKGERIETHSSGLTATSPNLGEELRSCSLDLTGLAKGIYIVQITTARGTAARKLAVE